jgi:hypothetical protein
MLKLTEIMTKVSIKSIRRRHAAEIKQVRDQKKFYLRRLAAAEKKYKSQVKSQKAATLRKFAIAKKQRRKEADEKIAALKRRHQAEIRTYKEYNYTPRKKIANKAANAKKTAAGKKRAAYKKLKN